MITLRHKGGSLCYIHTHTYLHSTITACRHSIWTQRCSHTCTNPQTPTTHSVHMLTESIMWWHKPSHSHTSTHSAHTNTFLSPQDGEGRESQVLLSWKNSCQVRRVKVLLQRHTITAISYFYTWLLTLYKLDLFLVPAVNRVSLFAL